MALRDRIQHAWNAFKNNRDPTVTFDDVRGGYFRRPDRVILSRGYRYNHVRVVIMVGQEHRDLCSPFRASDTLF